MDTTLFQYESMKELYANKIHELYREMAINIVRYGQKCVDYIENFCNWSFFSN